MKRIISLLAVLLVTSLFNTTFLATAASLPLRVVVNGSKVSFPDAQPYIDANQRVQLPVRFVTEALGAEVLWNGPSKKATIVLDGKNMNVYIGKKSYEIDGTTKQMDTAAVFKEQRTFVPLRFLYEGLGVSVKWDDAVKTVYITTPTGTEKPTLEEPEPTKTADVHGFSVPYTHMGPSAYPAYATDAKLTVFDYDTDKKGSIISLMSISFLYVGADPVQAANEAEAILRQKIEDSVVDSAMKYVRTKTKREDTLPLKSFPGKEYTLDVISLVNNDISIRIFWNK